LQNAKGKEHGSRERGGNWKKKRVVIEGRLKKNGAVEDPKNR